MQTPDPAPPGQAVLSGQVTPSAQAEPSGQAQPVWRFLISRKWLLWHATAALGVWGMAWMGDWQFHRAMGGNALSWAYTFEWPLFAAFGVVFWVKTVRDEFRIRRAGLDPNLAEAGVADMIQLPAGLGLEQAGTFQAGGPPADVRWTGAPGAEPVLASAWRAQMARVAAEREADPELAEYNAYLARLNAKAKAKGQAR
jgi:hypothetical protein